MDAAGLPDEASTTRFALGWVGSSLCYCQVAGEKYGVLICLPNRSFTKKHTADAFCGFGLPNVELSKLCLVLSSVFAL